MDDFLNLEGLDEETLTQLMELGIIDEQGQLLDQQMAQASALRNAAGPEGRSAGRVYQAANPLEHVAHTMQGIEAQKQMQQLRDQQMGLLDKQVEGRRKFAESLMRSRPPMAQQQDPFDMGIY